MYQPQEQTALPIAPPLAIGNQLLYNADCLNWLRHAPEASVDAVITDPPYGLVEYEPEHQNKMRRGKGGVWRLPPSFDGAQRKPLPRFTTLSQGDRTKLVDYFKRFGRALLPVMKPGAHLFIASNPLVSHLLSYALEEAGFERRGEIVRLVRTFRGGDRPKGAEREFAMTSTMPRSCWEPWPLFRRPISERTIAENMRVWNTGVLRRNSAQTPFLDVIQSTTTPDREREVAQHPSIKPQHFLRQLIKAALPIGNGVVLDPFAGSASTLAACERLGVHGIGIEIDKVYYDMAADAIAPLADIDAVVDRRQRALPL